MTLSRTVKELKTFLENFTDDAKVWAYEGEVSGIVVSEWGASSTQPREDAPDVDGFFDNDYPEKDEFPQSLKGSANDE